MQEFNVKVQTTNQLKILKEVERLPQKLTSIRQIFYSFFVLKGTEN